MSSATSRNRSRRLDRARIELEVKASGAGPVALPILEGFAPAAFGSFDSAAVREVMSNGRKLTGR